MSKFIITVSMPCPSYEKYEYFLESELKSIGYSIHPGFNRNDLEKHISLIENPYITNTMNHSPSEGVYGFASKSIVMKCILKKEIILKKFNPRLFLALAARREEGCYMYEFLRCTSDIRKSEEPYTLYFAKGEIYEAISKYVLIDRFGDIKTFCNHKDKFDQCFTKPTVDELLKELDTAEPEVDLTSNYDSILNSMVNVR